MHNAIQSEKVTQNPESGQEVAKKSGQESTPKAKQSAPKTHIDYWKPRLFQQSYTWGGEKREVGSLFARIQHLGIRKTFNLGSTNKEKAATKARDIYLAVVAKGWDAAEAVFNPDMIVRKDDPTVGEFLAEIASKSGLKAKTYHNYVRCFRAIVAGLEGIDGGKEKYDYKTGGHADWMAKIDRIRLASITPDKVQAWKIKFIKDAGASPIAAQTARRNANTFIRCARALFSPKSLEFVHLRMPSPLPFDGVKMEKTGSMRYKSTINPATLVAAARNELKSDQPEQYKIFLLALFCGLRRAEIDALEWAALDYEGNRINLSLTESMALKSDESAGAVEVDPEVMQELRGFMAGSKGKFVIQSDVKPKPGTAYQHYRGNVHFEKLSAWLRGKGIASRKPLHELRKEFGSLVNAKHGIYAAAQALRHASIQVTAAHYLATKGRVTAGIGDLLKESEIRIEPKAEGVA